MTNERPSQDEISAGLRELQDFANSHPLTGDVAVPEAKVDPESEKRQAEARRYAEALQGLGLESGGEPVVLYPGDDPKERFEIRKGDVIDVEGNPTGGEKYIIDYKTRAKGESAQVEVLKTGEDVSIVQFVMDTRLPVRNFYPVTTEQTKWLKEKLEGASTEKPRRQTAARKIGSRVLKGTIGR